MVATVLAGILGAGAIAGLAALVVRYLRGRDELTRLRSLFSRYVPEQALDEIVARRNPRMLWAQKHYATILCCRIRNFGFFSEDLSAEDTLRHLNEFYAVAGRAIVRHGGIIERLHADGITAVFGVLTSETFHEDRALRAALRIVRLANALNARWHAQGRRPFQVYAGLNSGHVVAGEVGFAQRREYAIVGHPAHVASSLQQAAEEMNASIVASASTFEPVADQFSGVAADALPLSGLRRLQRAYIVRGVAKRADEELLSLPADIDTLPTVFETEPEPPAAAPTPQIEQAFVRPAFESIDSTLPAMPELPPLAGDYESPQSF